MIETADLTEFITNNDREVTLLARRFRFQDQALEDVKQDIYIKMLETDFLSKWNKDWGSFNTFVGVFLRRFLINRIRSESIRRRFWVDPGVFEDEDGSGPGLEGLAQAPPTLDEHELKSWWDLHRDILILCKGVKPFMVKVWEGRAVVVTAELFLSLFILGYKEDDIVSLLKVSGLTVSEWIRRIRESKDLMARLSGVVSFALEKE